MRALSARSKSYFVAVECNIYFDIRNHIHICSVVGVGDANVHQLHQHPNRICPFIVAPFPFPTIIIFVRSTLFSPFLCAPATHIFFLFSRFSSVRFRFVVVPLSFSCMRCASLHFVLVAGYSLHSSSSHRIASHLIPISHSLLRLFSPLCVHSPHHFAYSSLFESNVIFCNIFRFNSITFLQAMHYSPLARVYILTFNICFNPVSDCYSTVIAYKS